MDNDDRIMSLLIAAKKTGASDLLLVAGAPPTVYVDTQMKVLEDVTLSAADLDAMVTEFLNERRLKQLKLRRDLDFSFGHAQLGRFRFNIHYQRGSIAVAVRMINADIPELQDLNLPPGLAEAADLPRGLVLVTGPTGSGKSTTLAAMLERINQRRRAHVITLEDPIEFAFSNKQSIIEQREIGDDSPSFADALRHVVRQKPDVILVGEMRDLETISAALTAAETGHLVLASLHTSAASQTIDRIVDIFDSGRQSQVRIQLSSSLRAIACQTLFHNERDGGMVPAVELLFMTPAIARAIRDSNTHLIRGMIETGSVHGMQTLDTAIANLVRKGVIGCEAAMAKADDPERLERLLGQDAGGAELVVDPAGNHLRGTHAAGAGSQTARKPWE